MRPRFLQTLIDFVSLCNRCEVSSVSRARSLFKKLRLSPQPSLSEVVNVWMILIGRESDKTNLLLQQLAVAGPRFAICCLFASFAL